MISSNYQLLSKIDKLFKIFALDSSMASICSLIHIESRLYYIHERIFSVFPFI